MPTTQQLLATVESIQGYLRSFFEYLIKLMSIVAVVLAGTGKLSEMVFCEALIILTS